MTALWDKRNLSDASDHHSPAVNGLGSGQNDFMLHQGFILDQKSIHQKWGTNQWLSEIIRADQILHFGHLHLCLLSQRKRHSHFVVELPLNLLHACQRDPINLSLQWCNGRLLKFFIPTKIIWNDSCICRFFSLLMRAETEMTRKQSSVKAMPLLDIAYLFHVIVNVILGQHRHRGHAEPLYLWSGFLQFWGLFLCKWSC